MKQYVSAKLINDRKPEPTVNNCPICGGHASLFIANGHAYTRNPSAVQGWLLCRQCGFGMTKPRNIGKETEEQVKAQLAEYWNKL